MIRALLTALAFAFPAPALASTHTHDASAKDSFAQGEIRKVDKSAGKVTIKHGRIESLDMPAMTMRFKVKEAALLERLKPGDKVRFRAEKIGGDYTVTEVKPEK